MLSPNDLIETRTGQTTQRMRWPLDADTTIRLRRIILLTEKPLPWYRRLLRWLARLG